MKTLWNNHKDAITFHWQWSIEPVVITCLMLAALVGTLYAIGRG